MQNSTDILSQGLGLMLYGMGGVFVFLTVLVGVTVFMSTFVNRFLKDEIPVADQLGSAVARSTRTAIDPQRLRVLQAAVDAHRTRSK